VSGAAGAPAPERKPTRLDRVFRWSMLLVPFGVAGNLALTWYGTDRGVLASLDELPRRYLMIAVVLALVPWVTNALRIWLWDRLISRKLTFREALRITVGAEMASSVFPTSSGGEVFRWGMLVQRGITPGQAASIVSLGYLEDLVFFATALPTAVVLSRAWEIPVLQRTAAELRSNALAVVLAALIVLLSLRMLLDLALLGRFGVRVRRRGLRTVGRTRTRLRKTGRDFRDAFRLVRARGKLRFCAALAVTAVQWTCRYSVVTAIAYFLGVPVDPVLFFLLQWVIFTVMMFVPTPGASGGAEAAFLLVYSALLPARVLGVATAGWRFLTFYLQLAVGSALFAVLNALDARDRRRAARAAAS
jgi:uncharacterized protein (TIRG00374 family)